MRKILLLTILAIQPIPCVAVPYHTELQGKLENVVENYSVSESDFSRALIAVAMHFEIPMGIEWIELPAEPEKVALSWKRATVRQVLETIVKSRPGYVLEVGDQVVHIFYKSSRTDTSNFLNIKVVKFEMHDQYVAEGTVNLTDTVKRTFSPPPPSHGPITVVRHTVFSYGDHKTSFQLQNPTVRDVLDRFALATDAKIWIVTFRQSAGLTATGFRRTITVWNSNPILPDYWQPIWDMMYARIEPPPKQRTQAGRASK